MPVNHNLLDLIAFGSNGLEAQQAGLFVTGQNVGNVNTAGYHRHDLVLTANALFGVDNIHAQRASNTLLEGQLNAQAGDAAAAQTRADGLAAVQAALGPLGDGGLNDAVAKFFSAWRALSAEPAELAARSAVLAAGANLAGALNRLATDIAHEQAQLDQTLVQQVSLDNAALTQVAKLNVAIVAAEATGEVAFTMRDQRDFLIRQLATDLGATSLVDAQGNLNVLVGGGIEVVSGPSAFPLGLAPNPTTGFNEITVTGTTQGVIDGRLPSGQVGGTLALRDVDLPAVLASLDTFARDVATAVNGVHAAGYGLDGNSGRNFFVVPATGNAAAAIALDPAIANQPTALAAALDPAALPGDGAGALALVALSSGLVAQGNSLTLTQSLAAFTGGLGVEAASAAQAQSRAEARLADSSKLWEEQNGVSVEEQMLQLSRYQAAYQAATKVLSTINQMLELINRL